MKKTLLGLTLSLAALSFLGSPAVAVPLSAADQAFISSLAAPVPVAAAKRPALGEKSLCNATANCGGGVTVSCSGNNSVTSCSAADRNCDAGEQGHVTCDGVTTWCSPVCPANCDDLFLMCEENCSPCTIKSFQCSPYRCRCNFTIGCV